MSKKKKADTMEIKHIGGRISEVKQEERNGVPVGLISGYIATWDLDRGDDQFVKGAFLNSLKEHRKTDRQIRFKDNHGRTVGGYPIATVKEDETGLFGIAEVNLNVQQGKELHSLALQGVIVDFSIGFSVQDFEIKDGIRIISKARVWEGSAVDEPMNTDAVITDVKTDSEPPLEKGGLGIAELEAMSAKEIEKYLRDSGMFSRKASTLITSHYIKGQSDSVGDVQSDSGKGENSLLRELRDLRGVLATSTGEQDGRGNARRN
ncbi:HK97 family phage prohead protease [Candidatus Pacearchaeota archaeon]|nr:HK97 family phage prohead protease [Candidatus Pacearchaeota archaeon]